MDSIRYVVRFFNDDQYLYSVHCGQSVLDDLLAEAKNIGYTVKVVAYKFDSESEVNNG